MAYASVMTSADAEPSVERFEPLAHPERAGLYVHVPFCSAICPYCDFAVAKQRAGDGERYVDALTREARGWRRRVGKEVAFETLYLGGGTPSALSEEQLETLLTSLRSALPMTEDCFVIFEANPEDVSRAAVKRWRELGVHGVSLGLQSLDDDALRFLGRRHSGREGRSALDVLLSEGFEWLSADLIYSLPGSAPDHFAMELARLPDLPHLSCYELTIHEGTPFARFEAKGRLTQLPNVAKARWFHAVHEALCERGFEHYEVSNFARHGARSRHNTKYWSGVPYLGLGPSAHSYDGVRRWSNIAPWAGWSEAVSRGVAPLAMVETLDGEARRLEELMLRLRTSDGVDLEGFAQRHGADLRRSHAAALERRCADASFVMEDGWLRPTIDGMAIAERLAVELSE